MCGRFTIAISVGFYDRFRLRKDTTPTITSHFNITPGQDIPVILQETEEYRNLVLVRWGLIPSWSRDILHGHHPVNARGESLNDKPMFSSLVQDRRCLIPASGFFEWKKAGRLKIPYYIHRKDDALFAFAGLYDIWRAGNEPLYSCTIITTEPNRVVAPLHDRMPAILCRDDEDLWLGKGGLDKSCLARVLSPYPEEELEAYQVSRRVNDTSQDSVEIITPWKGESLILEEGV